MNTGKIPNPTFPGYTGLRFIQLCLALMGFVLSVFLALEERGAISMPCAMDCHEVRQQFGGASSRINTVLGMMGFAGMIGLLHLSPRLPTSSSRLRLAWGRRGLLLAGFFYGLWLVGLQIFHSTYCLWCLAVWGIWFTLVALEIPGLRHSHLGSDFSRRWDNTAVLFAGLLTLVFFVTTSRPEPTDSAAFAKELSRWIEPRYLEALGPCGYAEEIVHEGFRDWPAWRRTGEVEAPVVVTIFWDPLCTACRTVKDRLDGIAAQDSAFFRLDSFPVALRPESVPLVRALYEAESVFPGNRLAKEMMALQKELVQGDVTLQDCLAAAGLDDRLSLGSPSAEASVQKADQLLRAIQNDVTVPAIWINGRRLSSSLASQTPRCLAELIAKAWSEATGQELKLEYRFADE